MISPKLALVALMLVTTNSAAAQDWTAGAVAQSLEGPAHEALMALIERDATVLAPFETDGCSGGLSDTWKMVATNYPNFVPVHQSKPPWESCCVTHDRAYHNAANAPDAASSFAARQVADAALRACVIETGESRVTDLVQEYDVTPDQVAAAYDGIAQAMYLAVRFGGAPCSGLPWRWGYGYPGCTVLTGAFD